METSVDAAIWRADPGTPAGDFDYHFTVNETFHVLEGSVHIVLSDDQSVDLGPGDIAAFRKGTLSHWTVEAPFRKFFVIS